MDVTIVAFARLRELLGFSNRSLRLPDDARIEDAWRALATQAPAIADLRTSTRIACNGVLVPGTHALHSGDELSLLPPASGG